MVVEGENVLNIGMQEGRGVFHMGDRDDLDYLAEWDKNHPGCVILVHDTDLTSENRKLSFRHFSNSKALIELETYGMHGKPGASHFAELCRRRDILFLSKRLKFTNFNLENLLGYPTLRLGLNSQYWDLRFRMTNTRNKGRLEILDEVSVC